MKTTLRWEKYRGIIDTRARRKFKQSNFNWHEIELNKNAIRYKIKFKVTECILKIRKRT